MNQNVEKYLKYGLGAAAIGVGGFAALFLIKSIIALAIVGFGGLAIVNFLPVFAQWAAQMKIKAIKFNSSRNPVEDLQLLYSKKTQELTKSAEAIAQFSTEVKDYRDKLNEFKQRRPQKAVEFQDTYDKMNHVLSVRTAKLKQAKEKLGEFNQIIVEAQDIWDMTQAAMKANRAMKKFDNIDPMDEIRQKTALDSVTSSLNEVMADLETSMALDYNDMTFNSPPALTNNSSQVIDIQARTVVSSTPSNVKVIR
jgi:flagellar biosynthesis chaperone FliJ